MGSFSAADLMAGLQQGGSPPMPPGQAPGDVPAAFRGRPESKSKRRKKK
jgi:hypothetical protein